MQVVRPSRKRAGTSTNATPQIAARRVRLDGASGMCTGTQHVKSQPDDLTQGPGIHTHTAAEILLSIHSTQPDHFITPPTPCSSPEPRRGKATLDLLFTTQHTADRPGHGNIYHRNEFPFPIQPDPIQIRNKRLELTIPEEPAEFDMQIPADSIGRPARYPLPTPPRSSPNVPTRPSYFPSSSFNETPAPASIAPSSGLPSLCSSNPYSPLSPDVPDSPRTRFNSAASTLKLILMADHLGMTTAELAELDAFANAPMSGDSTTSSSKRAGRVLVRKDIKQRRVRSITNRKTSENADITQSLHQDLHHRRRDCKLGNCNRHAGPDMWREIDWSRFSDTSDDEMADVEGNDESDEEMSAMQGYMRMAIDAEENEYTSVDDGVNAKEVELGTVDMLKSMRPAELCMRTVEAGIGPLGERVWPCDV